MLRARAWPSRARCRAGGTAERRVRGRLGTCYYNGPMPVDEALARIRTLRTGEHGLLPEAWLTVETGRLHAMKGDIELARELSGDARQVYVDAGLLMTAATFAQGGAGIAFRAGDLDREEALLRDSLEILEEIGERGFYSTQALMLAECLYRAGADDREIEELCAKARETTPAEDLMNFLWLDVVGGLLHARRGEYEQAEERSRRAVALAEKTDHHLARSSSRAYLAEVLTLSGRREKAAEVAAEAFESSQRRVTSPLPRSFARVSLRSTSRSTNRCRRALLRHGRCCDRRPRSQSSTLPYASTLRSALRPPA